MKTKNDDRKVVKVAILGFPKVGKTTLANMLCEKEINKEYLPTCGLNIEKISLDGIDLAIWDLAGQERFRFMWENFITGAKLLFVITDSSLDNVLKTKQLLKDFKKKKNSKIRIIANKQDLPESLKPDKIQSLLGEKTFGTVAIDPEKREEIMNFLKQDLHTLDREKSLLVTVQHKAES